MRAGLGALVAVLVLTAGGCSGSGGSSLPSPETASAGTESPGVASVLPDQEFSLDDTAEFDDGLSVEIAGATADKAAESAAGADGTDGEIVVATLRIENNTPETFDPSDTLVTATYGDATPAATVTDPANDIGTGFEGPIAVADEGVAAVGFAVPTRQLKKVTIVVDLNDEGHEPVSFTGTIQRPAEG